MPKRKKSNQSRSGRLRIVAGNWRSRLLDIADVPGLRPTSERIRETLFNWLAPRIEGARCLDLFAGTGALGLEALSRGAKSTVFVENSPRAVAALAGNIKLLGATGATVKNMSALQYLRTDPGEKFDLVFLDPPFDADLMDELCRLLEESNALADPCLVYIEQHRTAADVSMPQGWAIVKNKTAGNVRYMLVERKN